MSRPAQKPVEPQRCSLLVPREEAKQRLQLQIEEGQKLKEKRISSDKALNEARQKLRGWSDYNKELLKRMVDTDDLVNDYQRRVSSTFLGRRTLEQELREYTGDLDYYINSLASIKDRLELIYYNRTCRIPSPRGYSRRVSSMLG